LTQRAATLRPEQLIAAVMLHTELGAAVRDSIAGQTVVQLEHAGALLTALEGRRNQRERADALRLRWYHFVVSLVTSAARLGDADHYVREGLGRFPRDPTLTFQRGLLLELLVHFDLAEPSRPTRGRTLAPRMRTARTLEGAAADYRRALEIDPHLAIARLHLGWVYVLQSNKRAHDELTAALADARDDWTRYLARLFIGGVWERQNRFEEAAAEYEAARQLGPTHQTPYVALSRVELARGRPERARELAHQLAALERIDDDPWWTYRGGRIDENALQWLRTEAHRR
jgi:tetratricopeptide (TPR) repeat protein